MKAAKLTEHPSFRLMRQTDVQNVWHMQMPRWLFSDPRYADMSLDAKVTYTFLLNRFQLSRRNGWVNDAGEVFVIFPRKALAKELRICEQRVTAAFRKLAKAESSMREIKELHQAIEKLKDRMFSSDVDSMLFSGKSVSGLKVVTVSRENMEANDLRKLGDFLRDRNPNTVAVLSTVNGEKVTLLAVCGKNAIAHGIKAGDIIRSIAPIVGGKGGGKPDSAMGGGTDVLKVDDALAAVDDFVAANVKE